MSEVTEINVRILKLLAEESENMTPGQIIRKLGTFSRKDVKYSIRRLREKGLIRVIPNLMDMRRVFYRLASPSEVEGSARIKDIEWEIFHSLASSSVTPLTTLEEMEAASQT